ncbi:carboxylate--amine ligase [Companilactobacillus halodurans]|uniref:Carboxylate--amine ligase n=1 Tax=Companilactobacillus halodurans TaxID=2584183 RepID=A0A5P0ZTW5_9LACO|nr:carboxylate--amine ligase [Companilactobacillus halodurans]MQS76033.1 carboxylate--amine ligase [Companilactobacillus halodurans]MQS96469.1 carboxylate--amine ligase [Companilactobacillus halodurans]
MNVYGMARAFHELYGGTVKAYAEVQLAPTRYTKILDLTLHSGFSEDPVFIEKMREIAKVYQNHKEPVILIGCGDGYAELISKHKDELSKTFVCPYVDYDLLKSLNNKESFYKVADEHNLPHPLTKIITKDMYENKKDMDVPFDFPVALKPANSVEWLDIHFEGRKKAFTIHSEKEYMDIVGKIYDNGYTSDLILQDFIPGDDSNMRVLNAYVDQEHHVKMMCLGHPILEDPTPQSIGNYVAIIPEFNQDVYDLVQKFLEDIEFTGYANFDMKYDSRDKTFKFFEINLRQGRSSFFVTLNGYNLAKYVVEDYIEGSLENTPTVYANKNKAQHKLWLGVPVKVFNKYAAKNDATAYADELIKQDRIGTTVFYDKDKSFKRWLLLTYMFHNYVKRFDKYFEANKGRDFK